MEQTLLPRRTVAAIMILYKNTKVKVHSPDRHTDFFDVVTGTLQGNTLAQSQFIICLDYVFRTPIDLMKENKFTQEKARSRLYTARTITDADYADDMALLANTLTKVESLLHSRKRAAGGIGLHMNADKIKYVCFNQTGGISTLNGSYLKLVDKFTYLRSSIFSLGAQFMRPCATSKQKSLVNYLRSSISSTENDIDTRLAKI